MQPLRKSAPTTKPLPSTKPDPYAAVRTRLSEKLKLDLAGDLWVDRNDALEGEASSHRIVLGACLLPTTPAYPRGRAFAQEPAIVCAIALAADRILRSSSGDAKAQHNTVSLVVATLTKLWECLWLNGYYSAEDVPPDFYLGLAEKLAKGGWSLALNLDARTGELLERTESVPLKWTGIDKSRPMSATAYFRSALRTNAVGRELSSAKAILAKRFGIEVNPIPRKRSTRSTMLQWLRAINSLHFLDRPWQLPFEPYPDYFQLARRLGRATGRTPNLSIDQAAQLLSESFTWLYERADKFLAICREMARFEAALQGTKKQRITRFYEYLRGEPLNRIKSLAPLAEDVDGAVYFNRCLLSIYISAFIVIAAMNARRKDEVLHRKLGLNAESMEVVSEDLGVYQCTFYVEKTLKDRMPFFVNKSTYHAWAVLSRFQEFFKTLKASSPKDGSLFWFLGAGSQGFNRRVRWLRFGTDLPHIKDFVEAATGARTLGLPAHAFRRFYALIFFYRYEHSTLIALSFQLQHLDLETTRQYITDALLALAESKLPIELTEEKAIAREAFMEEVGGELLTVGREKMLLSIESIIEGGPWSGKFGRLVLKLQAKLSARADYSRLTKKKQVILISEAMGKKGYFPEPFQHGDCMAGSGPGRRGGHCSSSGGAPDKSRASPKTCMSCPYHCVSQGHVEGLRVLHRRFSSEPSAIGVGTVHDQNRQKRLEDLSFVIAHHEAQLTQERGAP